MAKNNMTPSALRKLAPNTSLRKLSKSSGIALPHLSRIVNGKRNLTVANARRIAKALSLSIDQVANALAPAPAA